MHYFIYPMKRHNYFHFTDQKHEAYRLNNVPKDRSVWRWSSLQTWSSALSLYGLQQWFLTDHAQRQVVEDSLVHVFLPRACISLSFLFLSQFLIHNKTWHLIPSTVTECLCYWLLWSPAKAVDELSEVNCIHGWFVHTDWCLGPGVGEPRWLHGAWL